MRHSFSEEPDELAYIFFKRFARFEYALKAAGFNNGEGEAKPNWDAFAKSIRPNFEHVQAQLLKDATTYILTNPPKKQIVENGKLGWDRSLCRSPYDADKLLVYVRRVRNNLFHGGKFNGHWFEPERSAELMKYSLIVLEACLDASEAVNEAFNS